MKYTLKLMSILFVFLVSFFPFMTLWAAPDYVVPPEFKNYRPPDYKTPDQFKHYRPPQYQTPDSFFNKYKAPDYNGKSDGSQKDENKGSTPFSSSPEYQAIKLFLKDTMLGQLNLIDGQYREPGNEIGGVKNFFKNITRSIISATLPSDPNNPWVWGNPLIDLWSGIDNYNDLKGFFTPLNELKTTLKGGGSFLNKLGNITVAKTATKLTWVTAIGSGAFSLYESIENFWNGDNAGGFASLGDTLMSAAAVVAAVPGGQTIAAGMAAVGFVMWAGGTIVKNWNTISKTPIVKATVSGVKKVGKAIANGAKKVFNTVKGWFS